MNRAIAAVAVIVLSLACMSGATPSQVPSKSGVLAPSASRALSVAHPLNGGLTTPQERAAASLNHKRPVLSVAEFLEQGSTAAATTLTAAEQKARVEERIASGEKVTINFFAVDHEQKERHKPEHTFVLLSTVSHAGSDAAYGGAGGMPYDLGAAGPIRAIRMRTGSYVDDVAFLMTSAQAGSTTVNIKAGVESTTAAGGTWSQFGLNGGAVVSAGASNVFTLAADEVITKVEGRSGAFVDQLFFTTNKGRRFGGGGPGGSPFSEQAPVGMGLAFVFGRSGDYVDQISFAWDYICGFENGGCVGGKCEQVGRIATCTCTNGIKPLGAAARICDVCEKKDCGPSGKCVPSADKMSSTCSCGAGYSNAGNAASACADINECLLNSQPRTTTVCEGYTATLTAPAGQVLHIVSAVYGRSTAGTCPSTAMLTTSCGKPADDLAKVKAACEGKPSCTLNANNGVFGDPCYGTYKYLTVVDTVGACHPQATCTNTMGSRTCSCKAGFVGDGLSCTDINECNTDNGKCSGNAACTNTLGSRECTCKSGFVGNGVTCTDFNECSTANGGCDANALCTNTPGSRTCSCKSGFTGTGVSCADTNECNDGHNGGCNLNAQCTNTVGSRTCACKAGFTGDGITCTDVNECNNPKTPNGGCSANGLCTNLPGSRACACKPGFTGDGVTCTDVNECAIGNGGCSPNAVCANTVGSRTCACKSGFSGDGINCGDVNECLVNNGGCNPNAVCTNTNGGFSCACKTGFTGNGVACADVDECVVNNGGCPMGISRCVNVMGSRTCACNPGYTANGATACVDFNECLANGGTGDCGVNGVCTNTVGSRVCSCKTGFTGTAPNCNAVNAFVCPGRTSPYHAPSYSCNSVGTTAGAGAATCPNVPTFVSATDRIRNIGTASCGDRLFACNQLAAAKTRAVTRFENDGRVRVYNENLQTVYTTTASRFPSSSAPQILVMQDDGNLVTYQCDEPYWASNTWTPGASGHNGRFTTIQQDDGNLVLYDAQKGRGGFDPSAATWASGTWKSFVPPK